MKHGKRGTRSKPQIVPVVIKIQDGQKLLWRDRREQNDGFHLEVVDAAVMR